MAFCCGSQVVRKKIHRLLREAQMEFRIVEQGDFFWTDWTLKYTYHYMTSLTCFSHLFQNFIPAQKKLILKKLPAEIASNQGVAWCPKDIPQATWGSRRWYFVDMGWILGNEVDISSQMMKLGQVKRWAIKRFQMEMACFGHFILGAEAFCCRRPWNWMSWMRWRWSWKSGRSHGVFGTRTLELKKCLQDYLIFYQIGHAMKAHSQKLQKHFSLTIVPFISSWSLLWQHSESTNSMHKNCLLVRIPLDFFLFLRWFESSSYSYGPYGPVSVWDRKSWDQILAFQPPRLRSIILSHGNTSERSLKCTALAMLRPPSIVLGTGPTGEVWADANSS